jgi:GNAT superfamily N-acetyltransferase
VVTFRKGTEADHASVLGMFDEAISWLASRGLEGQWGDRPWSESPTRVTGVRKLISRDGFWVAESDGSPVGALIVDPKAPPYAPESKTPEMYVILLLVSRKSAGNRIGSRLLDKARDLGLEAGARRLRVDCWAGGHGALVDYYRSQGFVPDNVVSVDGWPAQILTLDLDVGIA